MKRTYQITAISLLIFSAFIANESLQLKYYTQLGPGPGFFSFWLSLVLAVLATAMFYQATFRNSDPKPGDFDDSRVAYFRMLTICAAWIWVTVMLEPLGYRLTMAVFISVLLLALGRVKWYLIILITILGSIIGYWFFHDIMRVLLPIGPFDAIFEPLQNILNSFV